MRQPDSDFIFEKEVYDLLTNGIFSDETTVHTSSPQDIDPTSDRCSNKYSDKYEAPQENTFEALAQRLNEQS